MDCAWVYVDLNIEYWFMDYTWVCVDWFELVCDLNKVHETNKI
jgi:hypothetical protein